MASYQNEGAIRLSKRLGNSIGKEALELIRKILADQLGLTLSPEKTHITTFKKGFAFLGFRIGAWTIRMRDKSIEEFKDKIREITTRSRNLDAEMIGNLIRIIRGTRAYRFTISL